VLFVAMQRRYLEKKIIDHLSARIAKDGCFYLGLACYKKNISRKAGTSITVSLSPLIEKHAKLFILFAKKYQ
jgi:hypothetical protein